MNAIVVSSCMCAAPSSLLDAPDPPQCALEIVQLDLRAELHPGQPRARAHESLDLVARLRVEAAQPQWRQRGRRQHVCAEGEQNALQTILAQSPIAYCVRTSSRMTLHASRFT